MLVVHPFPVLAVVSLSALVMVAAHSGIPPTGRFIRALAVVLCTQVPVGALNDVLDRDGDALVQPGKPIPAGLVSVRSAILLTAVGLAALLALTLSFGAAALALVLPATLAGLAYDLWLKPTPFAVIGYATGFLLLVSWLWIVAGHFTPWLLALLPSGVLLLLAAHLAQSLPDIETDAQLGQHGLARMLGPERTLALISIAYAATSVVSVTLAAISSQPAAYGLAAGALVVGLAAWLRVRAGMHERSARTAFFRIIAPGIGLMALASLVSVAHY